MVWCGHRGPVVLWWRHLLVVLWAPVMQWCYGGATYFYITTREELAGQDKLLLDQSGG